MFRRSVGLDGVLPVGVWMILMPDGKYLPMGKYSWTFQVYLLEAMVRGHSNLTLPKEKIEAFLERAKLN